MPTAAHRIEGAHPRAALFEVFRVFLTLGLTSFGGPVAHLGYFRTAVVDRRGWLSDREFSELLALAQFLPGPASSQLGFMLGIRRAGILGGIAAFVAFTLPSVVLMVALGLGSVTGPVASGLILGAKVVAVAVVAHAVLGMARSLTPDAPRASIAVLAAALSLLVPGGQLVAIALGIVAGLAFAREDQPSGTLIGSGAGGSTPKFRFSTGFAVACLTLFGVLLVGLPLLSLVSEPAAFFDAFYRSGALVFGGGHVVLPLLHDAVVDPGWVPQSDFLAGYGAAQALPGPLFSFAAYLGAVSAVGTGGTAAGIAAGVAATLAIFLPGFLLVLGVLPFWQRLSARSWARAGMRGANAAVVGVLAAALYDPIFTTGVTSVSLFVLALVCFVLLSAWKLPPWVAVATGLAGGALLGVLGPTA